MGIFSMLLNVVFMILGVEPVQKFPPILSKEEETEYFKRHHAGDKKAREKLIEHNLRLVAHVVRKYYSTQSSTEDQEMSVIQYGKRYFVSTGVALENNDGKDFDVVASLDGVVESVENSPIYGVVIVIKHQENVLTEYSSLSQAKVSVGDNVKQGDVIGVSGTCEFDADLASHVYFKVSKNSQTYDPLTLIGLDLGQIQ